MLHHGAFSSPFSPQRPSSFSENHWTPIISLSCFWHYIFHYVLCLWVYTLPLHWILSSFKARTDLQSLGQLLSLTSKPVSIVCISPRITAGAFNSDALIISLWVNAQSLRRVWLFVIPRTIASRAPLSMGFFLGKNTGMSCHFLLHGIFTTKGLNSSSCISRWTLYHWATWKTE